MSHLKDQLTREIAGIILRYVRNEKGRLSEISRDSRINRREFTIRGLAKMKLHRLLRILYDLCLELPYAEYMKMTDHLHNPYSNDKKSTRRKTFCYLFRLLLLFMKKIINVNLIIDTLPSCIMH